MQRSCWFYRDVLGLEVSEPLRLSGDLVAQITGVPHAELDVAYVRCPGHVLELLSFLKPAEKAISRLRTCDAGFTHLCLKVHRLERVLEAIRAGGFEALSAVQTLQEGPARGMRVVYARDPDGVVLELVEEPPGISFENLFFPTEAD
jgi:catechol 2,3-dioxygenase-like lactoylglutathione lyase family enzyme